MNADMESDYELYFHYARQLSAEHRADVDLYSAAVRTFGEQGVVDLTYLIRIYHLTCALLNSFGVPAPGRRLIGQFW